MGFGVNLDAGGSPVRQTPSLPATPVSATPGLPPPATPESLRVMGITNEAMVWEILYDSDWRLPMVGIDVLWTDATGETGEPLRKMEILLH